MNHTPGPWKAVEKSVIYPNKQDKNPLAICDCLSSGAIGNDTVTANARLISTCPEMLDLLKRSYHVFEADTERKAELLKQIGVILAKAEGKN